MAEIIDSRSFDIDEELLKRTDKLFQEDEIKKVFTDLTIKQVLFFSIYGAIHEIGTSKDDIYFFDAFPKRFMLLSVSKNRLSRQEALTLYKRRPQYVSMEDDEEEEKSKPKQNFISKLFGRKQVE